VETDAPLASDKAHHAIPDAVAAVEHRSAAIGEMEMGDRVFLHVVTECAFPPGARLSHDPLDGFIVVEETEDIEPVRSPFREIPAVDACGEEFGFPDPARPQDLPQAEEHRLIAPHVVDDHPDPGLADQRAEFSNFRRGIEERLFAKDPLHPGPRGLFNHRVMQPDIGGKAEGIRAEVAQHFLVVEVAHGDLEFALPGLQVRRVDVHARREADALESGEVAGMLVADLAAIEAVFALQFSDADDGCCVGNQGC